MALLSVSKLCSMEWVQGVKKGCHIYWQTDKESSIAGSFIGFQIMQGVKKLLQNLTEKVYASFICAQWKYYREFKSRYQISWLTELVFTFINGLFYWFQNCAQWKQYRVFKNWWFDRKECWLLSFVLNDYRVFKNRCQILHWPWNCTSFVLNGKSTGCSKIVANESGFKKCGNPLWLFSMHIFMQWTNEKKEKRGSTFLRALSKAHSLWANTNLVTKI